MKKTRIILSIFVVVALLLNVMSVSFASSSSSSCYYKSQEDLKDQHQDGDDRDDSDHGDRNGNERFKITFTDDQKAQITALIADAKALNEQLKALNEQLMTAKRAKDKVLYTSLTAQIKDIRAQISAKMEAVIAIYKEARNNSIITPPPVVDPDEHDNDKRDNDKNKIIFTDEQKTQIAALKGDITALNAVIKALNADLQAAKIAKDKNKIKIISVQIKILKLEISAKTKAINAIYKQARKNPKPPIVVDKTLLLTEIENANALINSFEVGTDVGNVSQQAKDTFQAVITEATKAAADVKATQGRVNAQVAALSAATKIFNDSVIVVIPVDKTALVLAIENAAALINSVVVGVEVGNVPQEAKDALQAVIDTATVTNLNDLATQADVDAQVAALGTATIAFNSAIIVAPADTANLKLNFSIDTIQPIKVGDTFEVSINLSEIARGLFYSADVAIYFDPTKLQVVDENGEPTSLPELGFIKSVDTSVFEDIASPIDNVTGLLRYSIYLQTYAKNPDTGAYYRQTGYPIGSATLNMVKIRFKAIAAGDTNMQIAKADVAPAYVDGFAEGAMAYLSSNTDLGTVDYVKTPFMVVEP